MEEKIEIKVAEAEWLYANVKPMTFYIFKLDYDYWYDMDEGYNDETENLNENGEQYVILNNCPIFKDKNEFPFHTSLSLEEAKSYAEKTVEQKLNWKS